MFRSKKDKKPSSKAPVNKLRELGEKSTKNNNENNNEDDYQNNYNRNSPESGLGSSYNSSERTCSISSSSYQASLKDDDEQIVERSASIVAVIEAIRFRFITSLESDAIAINEFDSIDLETLRKPLDIDDNSWQSRLASRLIIRYIDADQIRVSPESIERLVEKSRVGEIEKAVSSLTEFLKFRHSYQLNHVVCENFPKQFYKLNGIFTYGLDKNGYPILYISAHVHRKWSIKLDGLFRQFVAWHLNRITNSALEDSKQSNFVMCFDCNQIGYASIDLEFLKFMVVLLVNYYPTFCKYCLIKDNPWVFRYIWTLVKTWLPEEARNNVHMISAKELTEFIDIDQIPNCMKVNDFYKAYPDSLESTEREDPGRFEMPSNWEDIKDIDQFQEELGMTKEELKKFKQHVDSIEKEYQVLGAF